MVGAPICFFVLNSDSLGLPFDGDNASSCKIAMTIFVLFAWPRHRRLDYIQSLFASSCDAEYVSNPRQPSWLPQGNALTFVSGRPPPTAATAIKVRRALLMARSHLIAAFIKINGKELL